MAELKIKADSGGGTVSLKGPASTTGDNPVQLTLPVDDGTSGQYLKTDGSGALSWATVASVGGATGVDFNDTVKAKFGTDDDLQIFHDGNHTRFNNGTGNLYLNNTSTNGSIRLSPKAGEEGLIVRYDGSVELFYDNTKRFETTNTGAVVSGILTVTGNMNVEGVLTYQDVTNIDSIGIITARSNILIPNDTAKLQIGASQDLQIYHDYSGGSENSHIYQTTSKHLLIK